MDKNSFTNWLAYDIQYVLASLQSNGSAAAATQEFTALDDKWEGLVEDFSEQPGNPPTFGVQYEQIFGTYEPPPPPQFELEWWTWLLVALLVPLAIASAVLLVRASAQRKAARRLRGPPDPASPDTTFAMTDIMDSTKLWEALPGPVMEASVALHNQCLQEAAGECWGYLSFTEGDAFFIVFHSVQDAVRWALLVQERLLQLPWPAELLAHPSGAEEYGPGGMEGSSRATLAVSTRTVTDTESSHADSERIGLAREYEISTKSDASANAPSGDFMGENGASALLHRGLRGECMFAAGRGGGLTKTKCASACTPAGPSRRRGATRRRRSSTPVRPRRSAAPSATPARAGPP